MSFAYALVLLVCISEQDCKLFVIDSGLKQEECQTILDFSTDHRSQMQPLSCIREDDVAPI